MTDRHIADHDLERYYLGMVTSEPALALLEEHLLWCRGCLERAKAAQDYVDVIRRAIIAGNHDLA
jgi:hypothetical protein